MPDEEMNLPDDLFKRLLDEVHDGIYFVDPARTIRYWNRGAEKITGFAAAEVVGRHCYHDIMCHIDEEGRRTCEGKCPLDIALRAESTGVRRLYVRNKAGMRVPVDVVGTPIHDRDTGEVIGAVEIFRDASAYEEVERAHLVIAKLAATDTLTGLLNRRQMEIELELEVSRCHRLGLPLTVLFGDVDYLKRVNDDHGHACGDDLLRAVARVLQTGTRPYDRVSRFGGDEFVILLPETGIETGSEIAQRLRDGVGEIELSCRRVAGSPRPVISIGLAEMKVGESWADLLNRADEDLYRAKHSRRA